MPGHPFKWERVDTSVELSRPSGITPEQARRGPLGCEVRGISNCGRKSSGKKDSPKSGIRGPGSEEQCLVVSGKRLEKAKPREERLKAELVNRERRPSCPAGHAKDARGALSSVLALRCGANMQPKHGCERAQRPVHRGTVGKDIQHFRIDDRDVRALRVGIGGGRRETWETVNGAPDTGYGAGAKRPAAGHGA